VSTSLWIALRYLVTRRRQFAAFVTWVSVAGLALGVLVLTVVVSVMNGFDAELRHRILGSVPHLIIEGESVTDPNVGSLLDRPEIVGSFDFFLGSGMVTRSGAVHPVTVYGLDAEGLTGLGEIGQAMRSGRLSGLFEIPRGIVIGEPLAAHLGLLPGDSVAVVISEPTASGVQPRFGRYELVGTFEVGAVIDYSVVVVARDALDGLRLDEVGVNGARLVLADPLDAPRLAAELAMARPAWNLISWTDSYGELFQAVGLEKMVMFIILLMVVAVAAFSIVSGQMMAVADKRADIAILSTMGASRRTILGIFLLQGVLVSGLGIAVGLALGTLTAEHIGAVIAGVEDLLGFRFLAGTYFVQVPSEVEVADLVIIGVMSSCLCLASAWLPAHRAAIMNPLEGLHPG
jgi:lipoprotein-releasing system permease protein